MLTEKGIAKLKTKRGRYKAGEVKGLCLQVTEAGVTSWLLRYELAGRERWMGLGPYPLFKLKEARERARAARKLIADGIDPLEAKRQARAAKALEAAKTVKFEKAAQEYYDATKSSWRSARTGAQFQSSLRAYVLPIIGSLPVREIDKALVLKVIRPEWDIKAITPQDGQGISNMCSRRGRGFSAPSTFRHCPFSRYRSSWLRFAMRGYCGESVGVHDSHRCENWRKTGGEMGAD
jgi:hypothetical protein